MQWALVNTVTMELIVQAWRTDVMGNPESYWNTIEAIPGTIVNLIVYDGVSPYTPPDGTRLEQVPDSAQIGDTGY